MDLDTLDFPVVSGEDEPKKNFQVAATVDIG